MCVDHFQITWFPKEVASAFLSSPLLKYSSASLLVCTSCSSSSVTRCLRVLSSSVARLFCVVSSYCSWSTDNCFWRTLQSELKAINSFLSQSETIFCVMWFDPWTCLWNSDVIEQHSPTREWSTHVNQNGGWNLYWSFLTGSLASYIPSCNTTVFISYNRQLPPHKLGSVISADDQQ